MDVSDEKFMVFMHVAEAQRLAREWKPTKPAEAPRIKSLIVPDHHEAFPSSIDSGHVASLW